MKIVLINISESKSSLNEYFYRVLSNLSKNPIYIKTIDVITYKSMFYVCLIFIWIVDDFSIGIFISIWAIHSKDQNL